MTIKNQQFIFLPLLFLCGAPKLECTAQESGQEKLLKQYKREMDNIYKRIETKGLFNPIDKLKKKQFEKELKDRLRELDKLHGRLKLLLHKFKKKAKDTSNRPIYSDDDNESVHSNLSQSNKEGKNTTQIKTKKNSHKSPKIELYHELYPKLYASYKEFSNKKKEYKTEHLMLLEKQLYTQEQPPEYKNTEKKHQEKNKSGLPLVEKAATINKEEVDISLDASKSSKPKGSPQKNNNQDSNCRHIVLLPLFLILNAISLVIIYGILEKKLLKRKTQQKKKIVEKDKIRNRISNFIQ